MKTPLGSIPVGTVHEFDLLIDDGNFGVYRKRYLDDRARVTYVIAHLPSVVSYTEPPASAIREFDNQDEALKAFARWKEDRLTPRPLTRKQQRMSGPAQEEFDLGLLKTREQTEQEALMRRLRGTLQ